MEMTSQRENKVRGRKVSLRNSLSTVLYNWMATLFAYQPDLYFQIDEFRRKLHGGFVSAEELHKHLLQQGLLIINHDQDNSFKLTIRLDSDVFSKAKDKLWNVVVRKNGSELEFSCIESPESQHNRLIH